jgi:diguanylate cyclase (GGDEF)-like protein
MPGPAIDLGGIEVVELADIDLEFEVEEAMRRRARFTEHISIEPARSEDLAALDLFQGCSDSDLNELASKSQAVFVVPGYVLLHPGRFNNKVYFVIEGQLRLYANAQEKRPRAIVDIGQTLGLDSALTGLPVDYAAVATEETHLLKIEHEVLHGMARNNHGFALNYLDLFATHLRGLHNFPVVARAGARRPPGYVDEITLLHNQRWLDNVYPRLAARARMSGQPLALLMFAIDNLDALAQQFGSDSRDKLLGAVALLLFENVRPTDLLACDSNHRLVVILPEATAEAASALAKRIAKAVHALKPTSALGKPLPPLTLSMGLVALAENGGDENLLRKAEELVQESLASGGNCLSQ